MISLIKHKFTAVGEEVPGVGLESQRIVFCDPPYNIGVTYMEDETRDNLDPMAYKIWCKMSMHALSRHLMPGGTFWWLCPPAHVDWVGQMLTDMIGPRLYLIVKTETFAQYQKKTLTEDYRFLFCHMKPPEARTVKDWGKDLLTFNPDAIRIQSQRQVLGDKRADPAGRVPGQVWNIRRLQGTSADHVDWHPCQLAPELLERIVLGWSNEGDSVLDAFAGSGNMGLVCKATKRDFVGIDQSPTYCARMRERLGI